MNPGFTDFEARLRDFIRAKTSPADFQTLALELFALQFTHNLPYRAFCEGDGRTPESVADWRDIPAAPTSAFKEWELTCLAPGERTAVFHSSGTTGQRPSRHFHGARSLAVYELSAWEWAARHLPLARGSMIFLTPPPDSAPHSSLAHMFGTIQRNAASCRSQFVGQVARDGTWEINICQAISLLEACSMEPVGLLATAFNLVELLDALAERKLRFQLPPGSWVLETGGYKGRSRSMPKAELYSQVEVSLGVHPDQIVSEYGMSELSSQAYDTSLLKQTGRRRGFHFPPWARVQVVSPETGRQVADGEAGLIRVWDLANVWSVMAIETADMGIRRGGFELLGRAEQSDARGCSLMTAQG